MNGPYRVVRAEIWRGRRYYGYKLSCGHIYRTTRPIVGAVEVRCEPCLEVMYDEVVKVMELPE